jgi:D-sedoheptulose 7-phosphate isomerase
MTPAAVDERWDELFASHPGLATTGPALSAAFCQLRDVLAAGQAILVCGNGGSAADSEHIAGELAKSCALPRPLSAELASRLRDAGDDGYLAVRLQRGFPVLPLVSQAALLTAIANDQAGDVIFAQQVLAYGRPGDLLWALSTSGSSANVVHALRAARAVGMHTLGFTGPGGGAMAQLCDVLVTAPGATTPAVQDAHRPLYHALCLAVEAEWYA